MASKLDNILGEGFQREGRINPPYNVYKKGDKEIFYNPSNGRILEIRS